METPPSTPSKKTKSKKGNASKTPKSAKKPKVASSSTSAPTMKKEKSTKSAISASNDGRRMSPTSTLVKSKSAKAIEEDVAKNVKMKKQKSAGNNVSDESPILSTPSRVMSSPASRTPSSSTAARPTGGRRLPEAPPLSEDSVASRNLKTNKLDREASRSKGLKAPMSAPAGQKTKVSAMKPSRSRRGETNRLASPPLTPTNSSRRGNTNLGSMQSPSGRFPQSPGVHSSKSPYRQDGGSTPSKRGKSANLVAPSSAPAYMSPSRERGKPKFVPLSSAYRNKANSVSSTPSRRTPRSALGGRRAVILTESAPPGLTKIPILDEEKADSAATTEGSGPAGTPPPAPSSLWQRIREKTLFFSGKAKSAFQEVRAEKFPRSAEDYQQIEEIPKSLLLVWIFVLAELILDLVTTMIAFRAFAEDSECCGGPVTIGAYPAVMTTPFFLLVASEIAILLRAILLTAFPKLGQPIDIRRYDTDSEDEDKEHSIQEPGGSFKDEDGGEVVENSSNKNPWISERRKKILKKHIVKYICCWLRWEARFLMMILDLMVLLNPFFGCFVAWVLMYQSNKADAFTVLGLEAASLALHYISVWLEGAMTNFRMFIMLGIVPLVPFVTAVSLVLFYLKQGGVCYLVADKVFKFSGCEVCVDGYPPVEGICYLKNGTNYTFVETDFLSVEAYDTVEDIVSRTSQVSYCAAENIDGPQGINFCFFDFEEGQLPGLVVNPTEAPTRLPSLSTNRCGATVSAGEWATQCRDELWVPSRDQSLFCFASGSQGDACHLNIVNDGVNEGRFKDPTNCDLSTRADGEFFSYGDVLYLWEDPSLNGFSYNWAANTWLVYSLTRWREEMEFVRNKGLRVSSPIVTFQDEAQALADFNTFMSTCGEDCNDPESISFIDILALDVLCDPTTENCSAKAQRVAAFAQGLSDRFDNRLIHVTKWGLQGTSNDFQLLESIMESAVNFFSDDVASSPIERIFWHTDSNGDGQGQSNLAIRNTANKRLGRVWSEICANL